MTTTDKDMRYKRQNEKRRRQRALERKRRQAYEAQQAILVYTLTGNMAETGRRINASANVVSRRVKLARELLQAGEIVLNCEVRV